MSSYETNPYYSPEATGLAIVGDLDTGGGYEFDMLVVWQRIEDGALFWGTDSGCSCPSPFEDVDSVDDLTAITDPRSSPVRRVRGSGSSTARRRTTAMPWSG